MSKLLSHLPALCNIVKRIAVEAGEKTLNHFEEGMAISWDAKKDGSPVTGADIEAEAFIVAQLMADLPNIPIISEENVARGIIPDLTGQEYFWLVDAIDGTKEFISGSPDYTVNIALIKNGLPILGVIHAPAHFETFMAYDGGPAIRVNHETEQEKEIRVRKPSRNGLIVITSKNRAGDEVENYLQDHKVEKIIRKGSSLKICAVASGKADLYPGFGQTCEWDIAAGHIILKCAGGDIVTMDGVSLTYGNSGQKFMNPKFLARTDYLG